MEKEHKTDLSAQSRDTHFPLAISDFRFRIAENRCRLGL